MTEIWCEEFHDYRRHSHKLGESWGLFSKMMSWCDLNFKVQAGIKLPVWEVLMHLDQCVQCINT